MKLLDTRIFKCNEEKFEVISNANNIVVGTCDSLEKAQDLASKLYLSSDIAPDNYERYDLIERAAEQLTSQMTLSDLEEFYYSHQFEFMDGMSEAELLEYTDNILD
jgi:hypothetical protein